MESEYIRTHGSCLPTSLLQLLSNTLILYQTTPYLPVASLLALGASSKAFRDLINNTPSCFRYLDLSVVRSAQLEIFGIDARMERSRHIEMHESLTEDEFYSKPLRTIFNVLCRQNILQNVQTLILDGLSVTSGFIWDIICQDYFNVKMLSLRGVRHLNEDQLQKALLYSVRPSRPANTPKLEALYIFGPKDILSRPLSQTAATYTYTDEQFSIGVMPLPGTQIGSQWNRKSGEAVADMARVASDKWYQGCGKVLFRSISPSWANTILACQDIISFDAVLCHGPRHTNSPIMDGSAQISTHSLRACSGCNSAPEGLSKFGSSRMNRFPLLSPLPLFSSTSKAAKTPFPGPDTLLTRCQECLRGRFCENCHKWWCEDCYSISDKISLANEGSPPKSTQIGVTRDCWECGLLCATCITITQLMCKICRGGYCKIHNEGSTYTTCDWCMRSGRRTRELY